jgi:DNA-binding CsgD family transcriptional regulator
MLLSRDDREPSRPEPGNLTERQAEVVQLLVNGMGVKQIVRYLGISRRTVDSHLSAARQRMRARTREELIGWAVWTGIVVPGQGMVPGQSVVPGQGMVRGRSVVPGQGMVRGWSAMPGQSAVSRSLCSGRGGRPPMMTPERIALAREFLRDEPVAEVARKIGVGRSTLYEWLRANGG